MNDPTKFYVVKHLMELHSRGVYPEALGRLEVTEHKFSASPYDLVYNMREVQRSQQGKKTARLGIPTNGSDKGSMVLPTNLHTRHNTHLSKSLIYPMAEA